MKVVLDANQFVSGVLVDQGNPAKILDAWRADRFELVVSDFVLEEVRGVLRYPRIQKRLPWSRAGIDGFVDRLRETATVVNVVRKVGVIQEDPEDNAYLALALDGGAQVLVSGDSHLLRLGKYEGVRILTAAQFLAELGP